MSNRPSESLLSGMAYLGSARAIMVCMNLVGTSRLAHALGTTSFGINSFAVSYVAYFLVVVSLGYDTFVTREIAHDATRLRRLVDSMITMRLLLAAIVAILLVTSLFLLDLPPLIRTIVLIQGISLFSTAIGLSCVYQGLQRMRVVAAREFLASLINMIGILWLVHTPDDVVLAAWVAAGTALLTNVPLLFQYAVDYGMPKIGLPRREDWQIAQRSMTYFWSVLMISVTYNIHIVLLGLLRSHADVGLFSAGWKLFNFTVVIPNILSALFLPRIAKLTARPGERARLTELYMQTVIVCIVPITLFGCALIPQILVLIFGSNYLPASRAVALLLVNGLVVALNIGFAISLTAVGRQKTLLHVVTIGAAAGIILNLVLIPFFGFEGAAVGTLLDEMTILAMLVGSRPEISVAQTSRFLSRCLLAVVPAILVIHLVTHRLPVAEHSDLAAVVLGGAAGTMVYLLILRIMRIDLRYFALGLRSLN